MVALMAMMAYNGNMVQQQSVRTNNTSDVQLRQTMRETSFDFLADPSDIGGWIVHPLIFSDLWYTMMTNGW